MKRKVESMAAKEEVKENEREQQAVAALEHVKSERERVISERRHIRTTTRKGCPNRTCYVGGKDYGGGKEEEEASGGRKEGSLLGRGRSRLASGGREGNKDGRDYHSFRDPSYWGGNEIPPRKDGDGIRSGYCEKEGQTIGNVQ